MTDLTSLFCLPILYNIYCYNCVLGIDDVNLFVVLFKSFAIYVSSEIQHRNYSSDLYPQLSNRN